MDPLNSESSARERLIVALDTPSARNALEIVDGLGDACLWVKVGLELYLAAGPSIVEELGKRGYSVFLDLRKNSPASWSSTMYASGDLASQPCWRIPASWVWKRSAEKSGAA